MAATAIYLLGVLGVIALAGVDALLRSLSHFWRYRKHSSGGGPAVKLPHRIEG